MQVSGVRARCLSRIDLVATIPVDRRRGGCAGHRPRGRESGFQSGRTGQGRSETGGVEGMQPGVARQNGTDEELLKLPRKRGRRLPRKSTKVTKKKLISSLIGLRR